MNPEFSICVYCGSRPGERLEFSKAAEAVGQFPVDQGLGNDADDASAGAAGGFGHGAHQPGAAAAVDQLPAVCADPLADGLRRI